MATQFLQSYLNNTQYVPTSSVSAIRASTDKAKIDVSLTCENGLGGDLETFYTSSLYAFGGIVEFSDIGSLIEEYFRMRNKIADSVSILFDDISMNVHFLYCEYALPDDFDPEKSFFISAMVQRVHQDSMVAIAAIDHGSAIPFVIKAVGHHKTDDRLTVVEKSMPPAFDQSGTAYLSVAEIISWALNQTASEAGDDLRDVMYFSIEYFGIQKMCYIVPAPAYLSFSFHNIFNAEEFIDVVGEMTTKTDVSRNVAVCRGSSKQYDRAIQRTYEIQSEPLTSDEVGTFEQFLASHTVKLWLEGTDYDVIIEDHTCEPNTSDETLTTIKFTWRFADNRPHIFNSDMDGIMPTRRKIFNDTFSPEYE